MKYEKLTLNLAFSPLCSGCSLWEQASGSSASRPRVAPPSTRALSPAPPPPPPPRCAGHESANRSHGAGDADILGLHTLSAQAAAVASVTRPPPSALATTTWGEGDSREGVSSCMWGEIA